MKVEARIDRLVQKGNLKAIASITLDGMFVVKGLKVMDGRKGLFVSMPQETFSGKDGQKQYSNIFFALTNSAQTQLQEAVLDAYQLRLNPSYVPKQGRGQQDYPPACPASAGVLRRTISESIPGTGIPGSAV